MPPIGVDEPESGVACANTLDVTPRHRARMANATPKRVMIAFIHSSPFESESARNWIVPTEQPCAPTDGTAALSPGFQPSLSGLRINVARDTQNGDCPRRQSPFR